MDELQRQSYLAAMDIQPYFPKLPLAGAKASPEYVIVPVTAAVSAKIAAPAKAESPSSKSATGRAARELLQQAVKRTQPKEVLARAASQTVSPAPAPAAEAETEPRDELKFDLMYYRISDELAVISEVPHAQLGADQSQSLNLLQAILAALGIEKIDYELKPETFSWPIVVDLDLGNDPALEAKNALFGFIKKRAQRDRFKHLLVFAGQIDVLLVEQKQETGARDFESAARKHFMTVTTSLHSMLAYPLLKREVWQQLQPLRLRLNPAAKTPGNEPTH